MQARIWRFQSSGGPAAPGVDATQIADGTLPVNLAAMMHINALACSPHRTIKHQVLTHEAGLLASFVSASGAQAPVTVDYRAFRAASSHIQRFVCEGAGLGLLTASGLALLPWKPAKGNLHSFDALPGHLKGTHGGLGVRPDLLFHLNTGLVAGEARGRHRRPVALFPTQPTSEQRKRLLQLAAWSARKSNHPYFMAWAWLGTSGIGVDIFLPASGYYDKAVNLSEVDGLHAVSKGLHWRIEPRDDQGKPDANADADAEVDVVADIETDDESDIRRFAASNDRRFAVHVRAWTLEEVGEHALGEVHRVTDELYETADGEAGTLFGTPIRGAWAPAGMLGPARREVFLGVLAAATRQSSMPRGRTTTTGTDVFASGRLVTVVKPVTTARPSFEQLQEYLLPD